MKVYKGTDKNMKCRGLQYEIGKTIEAEGEPKLCENGLHACEAPLDVFRYYPPNDGRYFEAEADGVSEERNSEDSKIVAKILTLCAEIGIAGLAKAHVEYVKEECKKQNSATGARSANSATGARSANSATGDWSANSATGARSANSATGTRSANSATGDWSANSATGDWSANSATGARSANSATGYGSANVSTGGNSKNSGGPASVNVGWGIDNKCKGEIGSYIVLSEWGEWDGEKRPLLGAKMGLIDGEMLKADTWYALKNGEFVEVTDE